MDQVLKEQALGQEGNLKLEVVGGKLHLSLSYKGLGGSASLDGLLDTDYFMDLLKAAIPGQIDDAVIDILKAALKA